MGAISRDRLRREQRRQRILTGIALAIALVIVFSIGAVFYSRFQAIATKRAQLRRIEAERELLIERNQQLRDTLEQVNELDYIEYLARKELGFVRDGEEKYIILEEEGE
ncbi:MAG: septum formation initiator family protein [Candidatus Bipolaricaulia bacterium]